MLTSTLLIFLAWLLAIQGYLFPIQKDPSMPISFRNLSGWGKLLLVLTTLFTVLNVYDSKAKENTISKQDKEATAKQDSILALTKKINCSNLLYVTVKGILYFDSGTQGEMIPDGFRNLLNDFVSINVKIKQNGKVYQGDINEYMADINFKRCRNLLKEPLPYQRRYLKSIRMLMDNYQYIEIACPLSLRSNDQDCFVINRPPDRDLIEVELCPNSYSSNYLYKYAGFYLNEIVFKNYKNLSYFVDKFVSPCNVNPSGDINLPRCPCSPKRIVFSGFYHDYIHKRYRQETFATKIIYQ